MESSKTQYIDSQVRRLLEDLFARNLNIPLTAICERVENQLLDLVKILILAEIRNFAEKNQVQFFTHTSNQFAYDSLFCEVRIMEHFSKNNTLQIVLRCIEQDRSKLIRKFVKTRIDSFGRYTDVYLTTEKIFYRAKSCSPK